MKLLSIDLCDYRDVFGKPNEGAHKYRIFGVAAIDTILVIIVGFYIHYMKGWNLFTVLAVLFISGIIMHRAFCVRTTIDKLLFP